MLETGEGVHLVADIAVSRRKLIAEGPEDGEVDLVGSVRAGRVGSRPDVGRVLGQDVVHVMGLRFVGPDDASVERRTVGHSGVVGKLWRQIAVHGPRSIMLELRSNELRRRLRRMIPPIRAWV